MLRVAIWTSGCTEVFPTLIESATQDLKAGFLLNGCYDFRWLFRAGGNPEKVSV